MTNAVFNHLFFIEQRCIYLPETQAPTSLFCVSSSLAGDIQSLLESHAHHLNYIWVSFRNQLQSVLYSKLTISSNRSFYLSRLISVFHSNFKELDDYTHIGINFIFSCINSNKKALTDNPPLIRTVSSKLISLWPWNDPKHHFLYKFIDKQKKTVLFLCSQELCRSCA